MGLIQAWLKQPNVNRADRQLLTGTLAELRNLYRYMRKAERHAAGVNAAIASSVDLGAEKEEEIKDKAEMQEVFGGPSPGFVLEREKVMSLIRKIDGMYQQPEGGWVLMHGNQTLVLDDAEATQLRAGVAQILNRAEKSARDMNEDTVFKADSFMDANYDPADAEGVRRESSRAGVVVRLASGVDAGDLQDETISAVAMSNIVLGERKKANSTADIVGPQEKRAQTIFEGVQLADRARRIVERGIEKSESTAQSIVTGLTIARNAAIGMEAALATGGIAGEVLGGIGLTGLPAEAVTTFAEGFASGTTVARVEGKSWKESFKEGAWSGVIAVPSGFVGSRVTGVAGKVLGNSKVARLTAGTLGDLAGGATGFYLNGGGSRADLELNLGLGVVTGRLASTVSHPPKVAPKGETPIEPVAHGDPQTELSLAKPAPSMAQGAVQGPSILAHPAAEIPAIPGAAGSQQPHPSSAPRESSEMRGAKEPGGHRIRGEDEIQHRTDKETSFEFEGQQVEIKGVIRSKWEKQWARGESATLSEPVGADVDETASVGAKNISKSKQYRRATNPMNKSFMDSVTNRITKWTRAMRQSGGQEQVAGKGQVSLANEPEALFTKRIGEVKELRELHDRTVAKYADRRDLKPTKLKNEINGEFRRLIKEDQSASAKAARSALLKAGWDPATIRPTTRNTSLPQTGGASAGSNPLTGTGAPPGPGTPPSAGPPPRTSPRQSGGSKKVRKVFIDSQTLIYISDGNHPEAEAVLRRMKEQGAELHVTKQSHNELFQMPERFQDPQTAKDKLLLPKIQESFVRREAKLKELGITPGPTGDPKERYNVYADNLREHKVTNKQTQETTTEVRTLLSEPHLVASEDPALEKKTKGKKNDVLVGAQVKAAGGELFTIDKDFLRVENNKAVGPKEGLKEHLGLDIAPESWSVPHQPLSSRPKPPGGGGGTLPGGGGGGGGTPSAPGSGSGGGSSGSPTTSEGPTSSSTKAPGASGRPKRGTTSSKGAAPDGAQPSTAPVDPVPAPPEPTGSSPKAAKKTATRKRRTGKKQAKANAATKSAASNEETSMDLPEKAKPSPTTRKPRKKATGAQPAVTAPVDAPATTADAGAKDAQSPTRKRTRSSSKKGAPSTTPSPSSVTSEGAVQADAGGQASAGKPKRSRAKSTPGATASPGADPGPNKEPSSAGRKGKSSSTPRQKRIPADDPETSFKDIGNEIRKDPGSFGRERDQNLHPSTQKREQIHGTERKGSGEESETSPLSIPKYGVDMPFTGARRQRDSKGHLRNKSSELGYERDAGKFWREYDHTFDKHLSAEQKKRVAEGHSPVVDDHWIKTFPEHAPFRDQVLTHHHVGQGSFAVPLPEGIHRAHSALHPDRAVVGTPKKQTSPEEAQKILQKQQERVSGRQERELRRHAKEGRFDDWGYGKGTVPPTKGKLPLASPMAGMSKEELGALPGAGKRFSGSSAPAKSQTQQQAPAPPPQHPATASPSVSHVTAQAPPHPADSQRVQAPASTAHAGSSTPASAGTATQATASVPKSPAPSTHVPPPPSHEGAPDQHAATRSVNASRGGGLLLGPNQRGVQANAGVAATRRSANGVQTGQTVNVGGKMWAKVEEVPLSSPPRFHVTVTVDLTAEGGVSAGKEGQGGGAAGVNASISAQLTWATTSAEMSAEDAKVYLGSLQSGIGNAPEMNLARMISRGRIPDAKAYLARLKGLTKSADAAAHATEGEGATFTQATQGSVGAHASKGPVGVEVSVSKSKQLQISRVTKHGKVYVSVSILGETGKHLGGSLNIANTSFGVNHTAAVSQSKGATFVLDPKAADFKSRYDSVMAVDTVEDLNRVIGANKPVEEITGKGTSHETGVKATVLGGGFAYGEGGSLKNEDIKNEDGSVTHRVEGSGTGSAAFVAGDKTAAKYSQTDTFTGEVGSDNVGAGETRTARSETDLTKSASKFYSSLKKDTLGTLAGLPKGQTPILQEKNDADGKFLDDDAFGHLYDLSKDARAWSQHCNRPADLIEWNQLGAKIASSGGDRAKIQALMAGFESRGTDRNKYINQAVGLSGESYQFPDSLAELEPTYRELVRGNPVAHANELIAAGKNAEATTELTAASGKLTQMLKSIRDHSGDFQHNPEAYASMQEAINRKLGEIRTAMRKAVPAPPKQAQIGPQTPEQAQMDAEAEKKADAKAKTEDEIARKVDDCQGNRKVEGEMFAAIRSEFAKDNEEWYHFSKSDIYVINDKLSRLKELYARWDLTVNDLRDLYEAHGESPDRAVAYKPNRETYNDLHKKANGAYGGY